MIDVPPPAPEEKVHIGNTFSHSSFQHIGGPGNGNGFGFGHERSQSSEDSQGSEGDRFRSQFDAWRNSSSFEGPPRFPQASQAPQLQAPQAPQAAPTGDRPPSAQPYTIREGDTLWNLSDRMRAGGDTRNNWDIIGEIARDNGIKNPDLIFSGNTLNLRGPLGPDTFAPTQDPNSPLPGNGPGHPGAIGDGVRYISQYTPLGADRNYKNGEENCGPAVMAMIARERGKGAGMDDADLVSELGRIGHTGADGTSGNGLIAMADQLGLKSAATAGANTNWVMNELRQGKDVIANGDYWALPQHRDPNQTSPHYILLTGIDQNGNIQVEDPADPNVRSITAAQLAAFNTAHPDGGFNISVG